MVLEARGRPRANFRTVTIAKLHSFMELNTVLFPSCGFIDTSSSASNLFNPLEDSSAKPGHLFQSQKTSEVGWQPLSPGVEDLLTEQCSICTSQENEACCDFAWLTRSTDGRFSAEVLHLLGRSSIDLNRSINRTRTTEIIVSICLDSQHEPSNLRHCINADTLRLQLCCQ